MKKRKLIIFVVIVALLMSMAACANNGDADTPDPPANGNGDEGAAVEEPAPADPGADPDVVTLLAIMGNGGHTTIVERFNETHDHIQIELDNLSAGWEEVATKKITMVAAGMGPDITTVSTSYYPQFVAQGLLMDITDFIAENVDPDEVYWDVIQNLHVDGRLYGLPISVFSLMVYYNRDMFEEAGITPPSLDWNDTWTFDDFREIATQLSHGEGLDRVYGGWVQYQLERTAAFLFPLGLDYWGDDLFPQFDNQQIRDIHEILYEMVHVDRVIPDAATTMTIPVAQLFADGRLGMFMTGTWSHPQIVESGINFGILPTPGGVTVSYVDVYIPYVNSQVPDATREVMLWLISEEPSSIKYQEFTWGPQICRAATANNMDILFQGLTDEEKEAVFLSLDHNRPLTVFPEWAEFLAASLLPVSELMGIGEYTVDQGFDRLQREALSILGFD